MYCTRSNLNGPSQRMSTGAGEATGFARVARRNDGDLGPIPIERQQSGATGHEPHAHVVQEFERVEAADIGAALRADLARRQQLNLHFAPRARAIAELEFHRRLGPDPLRVHLHVARFDMQIVVCGRTARRAVDRDRAFHVAAEQLADLSALQVDGLVELQERALGASRTMMRRTVPAASRSPSGKNNMAQGVSNTRPPSRF